MQAVARTAGYPIKLFRNPESSGQGVARNRGWRAASAPVIVFTDDDCVPVSGWLAALLDVLDRERADIVTGPTAVPDDQLERLSMWSHQMVDDGAERSLLDVQRRVPARGARGGRRLRRVVQVPASGLRRSSVRGHQRRGHRPRVARHRARLQVGVRNGRGGLPRRLTADVGSARAQHAPDGRHRAHVQEAPPAPRRRSGRAIVFRPADVSALAVVAGLVGLGVRGLRPLVLAGVAGRRVAHTGVPAPHAAARRIPAGTSSRSRSRSWPTLYAAFVMLRASARYRTLLV